jgi:hypothetical protein
MMAGVVEVDGIKQTTDAASCTAEKVVLCCGPNDRWYAVYSSASYWLIFDTTCFRIPFLDLSYVSPAQITYCQLTEPPKRPKCYFSSDGDLNQRTHDNDKADDFPGFSITYPAHQAFWRPRHSCTSRETGPLSYVLS